MNPDRRAMVRVYIIGAGFHAALAVLFFILWFNDTHELLGINRWIKPSKFAITGTIYLVTLAILGRFLPTSYTERRSVRAAWIIVMMILGETAFVGLQSARGLISHFNREGILNIAIYNIMGVMIIVNTVVFVRMFSHFFRKDQLIDGPLLAGIRWGAVLFVVGSLVGGVMSALNRHTIGMADGGPGIPLVNFSTTAGDLRIAHFVGLHALQVLPLLGWLAARTRKKMFLNILGVTYAALFIVFSVQAGLGLPLLKH